MPLERHIYCVYRLVYGHRREVLGHYRKAREVLAMLPNRDPRNGYRILADVYENGEHQFTSTAWPKEAAV